LFLKNRGDNTMGNFQLFDNRIVWRHEREKVEVSTWSESVIRVRATVRGEFNDENWALVSSHPVDAHIEQKKDGVIVRNGILEAHINSYGRISFRRKDETESFLDEVDWDPGHPNHYPLAREYKAVSGDLYRLRQRFRARKQERFYGLGQHRHGFLNQKGTVIDLVQRNAEVCIPFTVSSLGYGFLWNNPGIGRVELAESTTRWVAEGSKQIDYLVAGGPTFADVMRQYADATGHAPLPPDWALGFWQSKLRYATQEELLTVAREYSKRGLPLSIIVIDYFHWTRQGEWNWDAKSWPDPQAMLEELEEMGIKCMVSIWPSVHPKAKTAKEMKERGLLVGTERGSDVIFPFMDTGEYERPVYMHYYDPTNPEAREFLWHHLKENYYDKGVSLFWLDACEPEFYPRHHDNLRFHIGLGTEVGNIYPFMHQKGLYEGMRSAGTERVINLCRSAWAGSQRFGAAVWSGDIWSEWKVLSDQIKAGLNIMMSGIPWWTTDIGGFLHGNIEDPDFQELIVRWFQYGVFCPLFRLHGYRNPRYPGNHSGSPNEVWSFGDEAYTILKDILFLRERLRPYIRKLMEEASEKGLPPMRPLFFDYPDDETCYDIEDEFLFGSDLLIAPVTEQGARKRSIYLPAGSAWRYAWDGTPRDAGRSFEENAPLEIIPVYIRECGEDLDGVFRP
jgi:alpha-D-xyloside xylohydrolase